MNALGDRCRSVVVLVNTASYATPLLDDSAGYHVGCVVAATASGTAPSAVDIIREVERFCAESGVQHRVETSGGAGALAERGGSSAAESLTSPLTVLDCTAMEEARVAAILLWMYGTARPAQSSSALEEAPYTLVAVLDVARGVPCPPPSASPSTDPLAWLRPTPSYYSELRQSVDSSSANNCYVYPVHMYSRYPVLRDCGLQERGGGDGLASAPVPPPSAWTNKSTLSALLRELAFKAGQLAKYGA